MLSVRSFENKQQALDYYLAMEAENGLLSKYDKNYYKHFVISMQNYPTFYNRKNIEAYLKFFRLMYLKPLEEQTQETASEENTEAKQ